MWLIMPLIYFMSWRSCRRFGQAFSETASWVVGYLIGTGGLLLLHYGGVGLISATPDDPAAIVAIITGFIGMGISRYLWKRRGGHLEPVNNPLTNNRWYRAGRAMLFSGKKKSTTRTRTTVKRAAPTTPTTNRVTSTPPASPTTSTNRVTSTPPASTTTSTTSSSSPTTTRPTTTDTKSSAARWGRVVGAMMQPNSSQRRPPPR